MALTTLRINSAASTSESSLLLLLLLLWWWWWCFCAVRCSFSVVLCCWKCALRCHPREALSNRLIVAANFVRFYNPGIHSSRGRGLGEGRGPGGCPPRGWGGFEERAYNLTCPRHVRLVMLFRTCVSSSAAVFWAYRPSSATGATLRDPKSLPVADLVVSEASIADLVVSKGKGAFDFRLSGISVG